MKVSEWLSTAKKLHQECVKEQQKPNKGSGRLTGSEARTLQSLQSAIGSHHGASSISYNEARKDLDTMFDMVKAGQKTPPLSAG